MFRRNPIHVTVEYRHSFGGLSIQDIDSLFWRHTLSVPEIFFFSSHIGLKRGIEGLF